MDASVIIVALISGLTAAAGFSLAAFLFMRAYERRRERADVLREQDAISELDYALDSALAEINRLGTLVKNDVDDKYRSVLFLYELIEKKEAEIPPVITPPIMEARQEPEFSPPKISRARVERNTKPEISQIAEPEFFEPSPPPPPSVPLPMSQILSPEPEAIDAPPEILEPKLQPRFRNPKHRQLWEMQQVGMSIAKIAKELGMGQGEVKLILDLAAKG